MSDERREIFNDGRRRLVTVLDRDGCGVHVISVNECDSTSSTALIPWDALQALEMEAEARRLEHGQG